VSGGSYSTEESYSFCPGCGHARIVAYLEEALRGFGASPEDVVVVTDIGCVGLADRYFATNAFHGLHGRSITYATGLKLANPRLTVVVVMGDGGTGIGAAHLLAAARRNIGITVVVANNFNYGMTGGQHSTTSPEGALTSTTPRGNLETPLDLLGTLRPARPSFLARGTVFDDGMGSLILRALRTDGFSLIDIWDNCVAYYARRNQLTRKTIHAFMEEMGMPGGVIYEGDRAEYTQAWREQYGVPNHLSSVPVDGVSSAVDLTDTGSADLNLADADIEGSALEVKVGIVIAGSAGQKIRSAATILGGGAIASGLWATQKNDYPITVRTGPSAAEVVLSPHHINYTGIEDPDVILVLSEDGLSYLGRRLSSLSEHCTVYVEEGLAGQIPTGPRIIPLPFESTAKTNNRSALAAVGIGAVLAGEGLYPVEAAVEAAREIQKESIARVTAKSLDAGALLISGMG